MVMMRLAGRVLHARHHNFAHPDRKIGHDAIDRADRDVLLQNVVESGQRRTHLRDAPLRTIELRRRLFALRFHLRQPGFRLAQARRQGIVARLLGVEFLSGDELLFQHLFRAIEFQSRALEVSLRAVDGRGRGEQVLVHGFDTGFGGRRVGEGRIQGRVLRCDVRFRLN